MLSHEHTRGRRLASSGKRQKKRVADTNMRCPNAKKLRVGESEHSEHSEDSEESNDSANYSEDGIVDSYIAHVVPKKDVDNGSKASTERTGIEIAKDNAKNRSGDGTGHSVDHIVDPTDESAEDSEESEHESEQESAQESEHESEQESDQESEHDSEHDSENENNAAEAPPKKKQRPIMHASKCAAGKTVQERVSHYNTQDSALDGKSTLENTKRIVHANIKEQKTTHVRGMATAPEASSGDDAEFDPAEEFPRRITPPSKFKLCLAPPDKNCLESLNPAGKTIIGHYILYKWPGYGWCQGIISQWNSNPTVRLGYESAIVNFTLRWVGDNSISKHVLSLDSYNHHAHDDSPDHKWILIKRI